MSKIPITIDVERYVCTELEELRKMHRCRDYSGMLAVVERIQRHVNAMEEALYNNKHKVKVSKVANLIQYDDSKPKELIKKIKEIVEEET